MTKTHSKTKMVFLPPITVPEEVRDTLRSRAKDEDRDLTKQTRKVLCDYANKASKAK